MKIADRVTLGVLSGLAGSTAGLAVQLPLYLVGLGKIPWHERAIGGTIRTKKGHTVLARTLGFATSSVLSSLLGIGQTYLYSFTGKDNRLTKDLVYGSLSWLVLHGIGNRVSGTFSHEESTTWDSFISLMSNVTAAVASGKVIDGWGDERLFNGQLPLLPKALSKPQTLSMPGGVDVTVGDIRDTTMPTTCR